MSELYKALFEAQKSVRPVPKASHNGHHNFSYVSAEDMIQEARDILLAQNLMLIQRSWQILDAVSVRIEYVLCHAVSGEEVVWSTLVPVCEGKGRPSDKAVLTALTGDINYTLRGLLCMPRVEPSTDVNAIDTRDHEPGVRMQPRATEGYTPKPPFVPVPRS